MTEAIIISTIALIVSVSSLVWTIYYNKRQQDSNAFISTEKNYITIEQMIADTPSVLKFHNISKDELESINITPEEFSYLLANFTAGGIYYRSLKKKKEMFELDSYRGMMLQSKSTREAWSLLKKCIAPSCYRDTIENTIKFIEKGSNNSGL